MLNQILGKELKQFNGAIISNQIEVLHQRRCQLLAVSINWGGSKPGKEFESMLCSKGNVILSHIIRRLTMYSTKKVDEGIANVKQIVLDLMLVHDLGKFDSSFGEFHGSSHEERSANIIEVKKAELKRYLGWSEKDIFMFTELTIYHGHLGITRLGESSSVFLWPLIEVLKNWISRTDDTSWIY